MTVSHVLCPIDFSEGSRAALRMAAAVAAHFGARLTVLTVDDPLLAEAARQQAPDAPGTMRPLQAFCRETLGNTSHIAIETRVAVGTPADEILKVAGDAGAQLIVMGSQGRSGAKKMFFGSTAERVLRDTKTPVLVTRAETIMHGIRQDQAAAGAMVRPIARVIVPIDFAGSSELQLRVAAGVAVALSRPLVLLHVLEPVFAPDGATIAVEELDRVRTARVTDALEALRATLPASVSHSALVLTGNPAEQIAATAKESASLIVIGLRSSGPQGRVGSVTYRVLTAAPATVLALPPS